MSNFKIDTHQYSAWYLTNAFQDVHIALVGKYTKLEDAYASVIKALNHAAMAANYRLRLTYIAAADLEDQTKTTGTKQ